MTRLAAAVGLLAHVREIALASHRQIHEPEGKAGDDRLAVSELRFRNPARRADIEALMTASSSAPLMDRRVDVLALTNDHSFSQLGRAS